MTCEIRYARISSAPVAFGGHTRRTVLSLLEQFLAFLDGNVNLNDPSKLLRIFAGLPRSTCNQCDRVAERQAPSVLPTTWAWRQAVCAESVQPIASAHCIIIGKRGRERNRMEGSLCLPWRTTPQEHPRATARHGRLQAPGSRPPRGTVNQLIFGTLIPSAATAWGEYRWLLPPLRRLAVILRSVDETTAPNLC